MDQEPSRRHAFMLQYGSTADLHKELKANNYRNEIHIQLAMSNPMADASVFEHGWKHPYLRDKIAQHPNTPPHIHQEALRFDNENVQAAALGSPHTTKEHLQDRHANSQYRYVREVAEDVLEGKPHAKVIAWHQELRRKRQRP